MSAQMSNQEPKTTTLGTLAWTGVVLVLASVALLILSLLGPVGGR
jgi:hypothetical protein